MNTDIFLQRLDTIRPDLKKVLRNKIRVEADEEDILQDVWTRLWLDREKWSKHDDYKPFALNILEHLIADHYREKVEMEPIENYHTLAHTETPDKIMESKELGHRIKNLIEQLPPIQQRVMKLKDIEGHAVEEIAIITNTALKTVYQSLTRARNKVKDKLTK